MEAASNRKAVILIADDNVLIRNLLRTILQDDYTVLVAANGNEALQLFRAGNGAVDILLADIQMPGMDGLSLYKRLRAEQPRIRALLMSGRANESCEYGGQPVPFLGKPFDLNVLRSRLKDLLAGRAAPEIQATILVVDENLKRRARTSRVLTENGYAVLTAGSVTDAKVLTDGVSKIDLMIASVMMDGSGGGVGLAEHVDSSIRNISTLLISHSDPAVLRALPGFSAQPEFLANPFTPDELLERVRRLIHHPRE